MMPLWTMARPSCEMCGCALRSEGTPCVAQRVCAMPTWPCVGSASMASWSILTLPTVRRRLSLRRAVEHGDAGGVVAAVFEAAQPFHEDGDDVPLSDGSDDAAHLTVSGEFGGR